MHVKVALNLFMIRSFRNLCEQKDCYASLKRELGCVHLSVSKSTKSLRLERRIMICVSCVASRALASNSLNQAKKFLISKFKMCVFGIADT